MRQGISQAGSAFAQALQYRGQQSNEEEKRKKLLRESQANNLKYGTILSDTLSKIPTDASPIQLVNSFSSMLGQGVPIEFLKGVFPLVEPMLKGATETQGATNFMAKLGIGPQQNSPQQQNPMQQQYAPQEQYDQTQQLFDAMQQQDGSQTQGTFQQPPVIPQQNMTQPQSAIPQQEAIQQQRGIQQPQQPQQPQPPQQTSIENLTDTQLVAMQGSGIKNVKAVADGEMKRREIERRNFREDRSFAYGKNKKFFEELEGDADRIGDQREALGNMVNAIKEGDTGFFSLDNFASFLGKYGEGLRSAKGAQLLNAQKEFLLSNIGRAGARPNMWIEQQISDALTKLGRSKEANLTVTSALEARLERGEAKQQIARDLENYYMEKDGTIPANFTNIVREQMKPVEEQIQKKLSYKLRTFYEKENSGKLGDLMNKKVPDGTPLTVEMATMFKKKYGDVEKAKENAKKQGYYIPTSDEYRRYFRG